MTTFHVVIPARYGSTRLPAKPLALVDGLPMVVQTAHSVARANPESLVVATDDQRIIDVVESAGFRAFMTRADHPSGSDRVLEVVNRLGLDVDDIVINVQGDEPLMPAMVLQQLASALANSDVGVATLCERIESRTEVFNPNVVKVVRDQDGRGLYFSRAPIPWARTEFASDSSVLPNAASYLRHIGVYAYRVSALRTFVSLPPGHLEQLESLEQLRLLENGLPILVLDSAVSVPGGVDTADDLQRINNRAR